MSRERDPFWGVWLAGMALVLSVGMLAGCRPDPDMEMPKARRTARHSRGAWAAQIAETGIHQSGKVRLTDER